MNIQYNLILVIKVQEQYQQGIQNIDEKKVI